MIPFKEIINVAKALPKCGLEYHDNGVCWIVDAEGVKVGDINFALSSVSIYEGYEHSAEVRKALGEGRFVDVRKEFPIPDPPDLGDIGRALYE